MKTDDIHKLILYLEGAVLVSDSENQAAKDLVNVAVEALLSVEKQIDMGTFSKLSHCIVSTGQVLNNQRLKAFILKYLKEHVKDEKFPADLKRNLLNLVKQTSISNTESREILQHGFW
jgi:hypothetical protein